MTFPESIDGNAFRRIASNSLAFAIISVMMVQGAVTGLFVYEFYLNAAYFILQIALIDVLMSSYMFIGFMTVSSAIVVYQIRKENDIRAVSSGKVTAVIPTYRDSEVLQRSVESLRNSDYEDLEIVIVCEEDDREAIKTCKSFRIKYGIEYLINENSSTKAGAINYAAEKTGSDYLAFFDADQKMEQGLISKGVALLSDHDVVQSRIVPEPGGFTESMAYFESLFLNYIPRRLMGSVISYSRVGSRGTVMRREVFERLGGYSEDFMTEDMEFSMRCYENGVDVKEVLEPVCREESPHSFRDWWGQRKRWMRGYTEVFLSRLKEIPQSQFNPRIIKSASISASFLLGGFFLIGTVSKFLTLLLIGLLDHLILLLAVLIAIGVLLRMLDRSHIEKPLSILEIAVIPLIFTFYSIVTIKSVSDTLTLTDYGWYSVEKIPGDTTE